MSEMCCVFCVFWTSERVFQTLSRSISSLKFGWGLSANWTIFFDTIFLLKVLNERDTQTCPWYEDCVLSTGRVFPWTMLMKMRKHIWKMFEMKARCLGSNWFLVSYRLANSSDICIWFFSSARNCSSNWKFASMSCLFFNRMDSASPPNL